MALTLPVEEMSRLQVFFKLSFPDGKLTFEMASSSSASQSSNHPTISSGLKLHFQGGHDKTGLCLKVWASELWEEGSTMSEDTPSAGNPSPSVSMPPTIPSASPASTAGMTTDMTPTQSTSTGHYSPTVPLGSNVPTKAQDGRQGASNFSQPYADLNGDLFQWPVIATEPHIADDFDYHLDEFDLGNMKWLGYGPGMMNTGEAPLSPEMGHLQGSDPHPLHHVESKHNSMDTIPNMLSSPHQPITEFIPIFQHTSTPSTITSPSSMTSYSSSTIRSASSNSTPLSEDMRSPTARSDVHSLLTDASATPSTRHSTPEIDSSRPYRCLAPDCDRWFKRDYTRKVHMLTHRRTKERKPFGCSVVDCPERFSRKHDRLRHEVGRHGLGSDWRCAPCNRFFSSKATLERHILDKHGEGAVANQP